MTAAEFLFHRGVALRFGIAMAALAAAFAAYRSQRELLWNERRRLERITATLERTRANLVAAQQVAHVDQRLAEERARRLAHYDALTGLADRDLVTDRLTQALAWSRQRGQQTAVMLVDLDRFKRINDSCGHAAGDEVLAQIATRLSHQLRETDTIGRLGEDEFAIVAGGLETLAAADAICAALAAAIEKPLSIAGRELFVTASIGVARAPLDGDEACTLLRNAGSALHRAKEHGGRHLTHFAPEMHTSSLRRLALENGLKQIRSSPGFSLRYQPLFVPSTGHIHAAEALIRWRHPTLGDVHPSEFIPLAEQTGSIGAIGEWTIEAVCEQARRWTFAYGYAPRLGVNISPRQLQLPGFVSALAQAVRRAGLAPGALILEITETAFVRDVAAVRGTLQELKECGFLIAVDDFGIGYSTLEYLRHFPVDIVKIDRGFVSGSTCNPVDHAIVRSVTMLAKSLGLTVVAEGVESREQLDLMLEIGCDLVQGFHLASPLHAPELAQRIWAADQAPDAVRAGASSG
ncbi:EAL domain-containing protein [bacterium]|nr:MAG: EAL domain-containing protein [bacterium]